MEICKKGGMMVGKKAGQAAIERSGAARRGQAAMEYLMTYGWALLVIVIVIAILLIMNPFSAPQTCRFDSIGFACDNIAVKATDHTLLGSITNGNNNGITVFGVACTKQSASAPTAPAQTGGTKVARQAKYSIPSTVKCNDAPTKAGDDFSGKVWVFYNNDEDDLTTYPVRVASANLVTKVI